MLQALLSRGTAKTFNAVTVDSDTSTSDTLLIFATGTAARRGAPAIADPKDARLGAFRRALGKVLKSLALQVVRDGEGARKQVEVTVTGAEIGALGQAHRAVDRQFAAGQDGDRRRGRQLGPRRHGGRQGRRAGRPRPAVDLVRRHPAGARGRARPRLFRSTRRRPT